jgi:hypothetical protein
MNSEGEKTCPSCGKALKEGVSFCTNCGAAVIAGAAAAGAAPPGPQEATQPQPPSAATAAPVPPVPPTAGAVGAEAPAPGFVPVPPPKKNKAALVIGVLGGILVVAGIVVLVLWLTMWRGGDGGGGGAGNPVALAEKYIDSLEKGDIDAYMECFQEDFFINEIKDNPLMEGMGLSEEEIKEYAKMAFEMMEVKFENVELEISSEKGDKATVVTSGGTASVSVFGMGEELDLADDPLEFNMVKVDGDWYLTENPMGTTTGTGTDFNLEDLNLEDFNLEDLEQYLPEDLNLEDLENMNMEDLDKLLQDLEKMLENTPVDESST